jgi:hypothetical protein
MTEDYYNNQITITIYSLRKGNGRKSLPVGPYVITSAVLIEVLAETCVCLILWPLVQYILYCIQNCSFIQKSRMTGA